MYQLFVETETSFAPDLAGEFKELDDARAAAKQAQAENPGIRAGNGRRRFLE